MPRCHLHGTEYLFECPDCKRERTRQEEVLEQQQRAAEALEDQSRQLERMHKEEAEALEDQSRQLEWMHEEEMEAATKRQAALDAAVDLQQARLKDERDHRLREEVRATLRAGLPEFSESFQQGWSLLNKQMDSLAHEEAEYEAARAAATAERDRHLREHERERTTLREQFKSDFDRLLRANDPVLKTLVVIPSSADPHALSAATSALDQAHKAVALALEGGPRSTPIFGNGESQHGDTLPRDAATLLADLGSLQSRADVLRPAGPPKELGDYKVARWAGCLSFPVFYVLLFTLAAFVFYPPEYYSGHLCLIPIASALFASALLRSFVTRSRRERDRTRLEVWQRIDTHLRAVASSLGPVFGLTKCEMLPEVTSSIRQQMLDSYVVSQFAVLPTATKLRETETRIKEAEESLQAANRTFAAGQEARDRVKQQYAFYRSEILRVGREVIEGVRVPGRKDQAVRCPQCGGPITSEAGRCPYCGASHAIP